MPYNVASFRRPSSRTVNSRSGCRAVQEVTRAPRRTQPPTKQHAPAPHHRGPRPAVPARAEPTDAIGISGERLRRDEAFDLLRQAVASLTSGDNAVRASTIRSKARELLGRDSESLSDRNFPRI